MADLSWKGQMVPCNAMIAALAAVRPISFGKEALFKCRMLSSTGGAYLKLKGILLFFPEFSTAAK